MRRSSAQSASVPKIASVSLVGDGQFHLMIENFSEPLWLCIQQDFYSKPSNRCNSGQRIESAEAEFFTGMQGASFISLFSDDTYATLFDERMMLVNGVDVRLLRAEQLCGTVTQDEQGSFFIGDHQLLTSPGWKHLLPMVGKDVCVKGEKYQRSFRVYFVAKNVEK